MDEPGTIEITDDMVYQWWNTVHPGPRSLLEPPSSVERIRAELRRGFEAGALALNADGHIVAATATAPARIPTDTHDLAELIRAEPPSDGTDRGPNLYDRLQQQEGHDRASKLWRQACNEIDNQGEIVELRGALVEDIDVLTTLLSGARDRVDRLASDQVYDVEFAESTAGTEIRDLLSAAATLLDLAARRINDIVSDR